MFTAHKFALQNIYHQSFRSLIFFLLVFISSTSIFGTGIIMENMQQGVDQAKSRIGADIIVVPSQYSDNAKSALFEGQACTIPFEGGWAQKLGKVDGVKKTSAQLYLETLSLDCCAAGGIQIIALDINNDFAVGAWMKHSGISELNTDEMIVGSGCGLKVNDTIKFFNRNFKVVDVLEETGMGYDKSAFVSFDTAKLIASDPEYSHIFKGKKDMASMVLVVVSDKYNVDQVRQNIINAYPSSAISVYSVSHLVDTLSAELEDFKSFHAIMNVFVILLAAVSLFSLVTITSHQRRNRVGSLLSVGIEKKKIVNVFLLEYLYLMLAGVAAGILLVCIFVFPLHSVIKQMLNIPYKFIGIEKFAGLIVTTIAVNAGILFFSTFFSFFKILKFEPAVLAKEENR